VNYDTTAVCRQGTVEKVYIKGKCGYSILLDTVNCWTQYFTEHNNMQETVICRTNCILDI
jgi:hypothetical protein